jgi:dienelactone hydrolase
MRLALLLAGLLTLAAPNAARASELACTGDPAQAQRYDMSVGGQPAYGRFAAPAASPTALVVLAHGYSFNSQAYEGHGTRVAAATGALAVAPNYRATTDLPPDDNRYQAERSRGWPVKTGAEDVVAVAQLALARCPTIRTVVLYGFSMGGNVTGYALASKPKRPDGSPLFDFWVAVEGVHNITEEYEAARILAPANTFAAQAAEDIAAETGGTPETAPDAYRERTNTVRVPDIAGAGLKGVVVIHARADGEAPYSMAGELVNGLRATGVPTDFYSIGSRGPTDDPDTSLATYTGQNSDQAGHASDPSENHITPRTAYDRVAALLVRAEPDPCNRDFMVEGRDSSVSPDPAAPSESCPRGEVRSRPGATPGGSAPPVALCASTPARTSRLRIRRRGHGLVVRGRVRRSTCARTGVLRVEVAVVRHAGKRCRVVRHSGRMSRRMPCSAVPFRRARGHTKWSLRFRRVPVRKVVVLVRARDGRGAGHVRSVRVRHR